MTDLISRALVLKGQAEDLFLQPLSAAQRKEVCQMVVELNEIVKAFSRGGR